ncbi:hypothetical protein IAU59_001002 [Kwoniella sp. CBS 9459]
MSSVTPSDTNDQAKAAGSKTGSTEAPAGQAQAQAQAQPASPAETIHAEPSVASTSTTSTSNTAPIGTREGVQSQSSDATGTNNAASTVQRAFTQSLNRGNFEEEVGQVMGTLNSWWGGVKKQSASALTSLKADLDKGLTQAQADLEYLRNAKVEVVAKDPAEYAAEQEAEKAKKAASKAAAAEEEVSRSKGKGKEKAVDPEETREASATDAGSSATAFLNRLTSSTSQLQHSLQNTLQSTLAAASNNPALSNPNALRQQLAENLRLSSAKENLQLSMKQAEKLAEEYLKKSEGWVKDAEKWMEDAVKVVPPDEDQRLVSVSWDGSDWYSFSTSTPEPGSATTAGDVLFDSGDAKSRRSSLPSLALASSRKDALLRRLREDKDALLVDPEGEKETEERKAEFRAWVKEHWEEQKQDGREEEEGNVGAVRMALVPEHLTDEQFWQRYLFHKHMIEAEEKKRKALLQATTQEEDADDFNWDDEEDPTSPTTAKSPTTALSSTPSLTQEATPKIDNDGKLPSATTSTSTPAVASASSAAGVLASASTSPRDSEESYDVVSDQGGLGVGQTQAPAQTQGAKPSPTATAGAAPAPAKATPPAAAAPAAPATEDDDDSDWE